MVVSAPYMVYLRALAVAPWVVLRGLASSVVAALDPCLTLCPVLGQAAGAVGGCPCHRSSSLRVGKRECLEQTRIVIAHLSSLVPRSTPRRMLCSSVGYPCRTAELYLLPRGVCMSLWITPRYK